MGEPDGAVKYREQAPCRPGRFGPKQVLVMRTMKMRSRQSRTAIGQSTSPISRPPSWRELGLRSTLGQLSAVGLAATIACSSNAQPNMASEPPGASTTGTPTLPPPTATASAAPSPTQARESTLKLTADFASLEKRRKEDISFPAVIEGLFEGQPVKWDGNVVARGNSTREACEYVPLAFKPSEVIASIGGSKLKLFRHCGVWDSPDDPPRVPDTSDWIRRQLNVYAVFHGLLGDNFALRTWPVAIEYYQTGQAAKLAPHRDAFILEPVEAFAARTNGTVVKKKKEAQPLSMDSQAVVNGLLVAFVTGAHDLSVTDGEWQNVELVRTAQGAVIPLFYDFDMAATVRGKLDPWEDHVLHGWCKDWNIDVLAAATALWAKWRSGVEAFQQAEARTAHDGMSDRAQHVVSRYVTKRFAWLLRVLGDSTKRDAFLKACSIEFCKDHSRGEECPALNETR